MADTIERLAEQLAGALAQDPEGAAWALHAIVCEACQLAGRGDFALVLALADRCDDAIQRARTATGLPQEPLSNLAMLAHEVCAVLALVGSSHGRRDSGYYQASLAHAQRLDAMTEGALRLVELVNAVGA